MEERYCVFWFPSIYHTPINERLKRFEVEKTITDFGSEVVKLKVSISYKYNKKKIVEEIQRAQSDENLVKSCLKFEVYKTNKDGQKENIFEDFHLEYKNHSNNGMVVYSYKEPQDYPKGEGIPSFEKALKTIFYHCAKSLFHNHEVQMDRDSGLEAFVPDSKFKPDNILEKNNKAITSFFEQYETIFIDYAERASVYIGQRDSIVTKFEGKLSLADNDTIPSGYRSLTLFGRRVFRQWYENPIHKLEVSRCKKDVLFWQVIIDPRYKKWKRRREHYIDRHNDIAEVLIPILEANTLDENVKEYRIVERYNAVGEFLKERGDVSWKQLTRKDLHPINFMLEVCEIGLGINHSKLCRCKLYKKLQEHYTNLPLLTENARKKIGMLCEGAITEYVYCKTLLESKYNTFVNHEKFEEEDNNTTELDKWRKKACNIRNSIRYIETVKYRCLNSQSNGVSMALKRADKLSRNAKIWTVIGIILSIIGVVLTAVGIILAKKGSCGCC